MPTSFRRSNEAQTYWVGLGVVAHSYLLAGLLALAG
jgi:hypothetical protein